MAGVVLAVCTGNVCRSPFVERMLAAMLPGSAWQFASAGLHAMVGSAMSPAMTKQLRAAGGSDEGFAARQLTADMVRSASLVIALERHHRAKIVSVVPDARDKTFTLRELGRLAALVPAGSGADRGTSLVPALGEARGRAAVVPPAEDDVPDPFGGSRRDYRASAQLMLEPLRAVAALLG